MGVVLGSFFNPMIGTTEKLTSRIGNTIAEFITGFRATMGPRLVGDCTSSRLSRVGELLCEDAHFSCCLLLTLSLPVVLGVSFVLRL